MSYSLRLRYFFDKFNYIKDEIFNNEGLTQELENDKTNNTKYVVRHIFKFLDEICYSHDLLLRTYNKETCVYVDNVLDILNKYYEKLLNKDIFDDIYNIRFFTGFFPNKDFITFYSRGYVKTNKVINKEYVF